MPMTDHRSRAETLLDAAQDMERHAPKDAALLVARAQVHALLALAAPTPAAPQANTLEPLLDDYRRRSYKAVMDARLKGDQL